MERRKCDFLQVTPRRIKHSTSPDGIQAAKCKAIGISLEVIHGMPVRTLLCPFVQRNQADVNCNIDKNIGPEIINNIASTYGAKVALEVNTESAIDVSNQPIIRNPRRKI